MGWLFSGTKKVVGRFFNFRVDQWIDYANFKSTALYIGKQAKFLFSAHKPLETSYQDEDFLEALTRLNLTEEDLAFSANQYKRFTLLFLLLTFLIFLYFLFLLFLRKNYMGSCMAFALVFYGLSQAMRYHFWYFQIKKRKLGCTFQEWWSGLFRRGF